MRTSFYSYFVCLVLFLTGFCLNRGFAQVLQADALGRFDGGFAKIQQGGRTLQLFRTGKLLVDEVTNYGDSLFIAIKNDAYGAINAEGKVIAPFIYDEVRSEYDFRDGSQSTYSYCYPVVKLKGKYGAFDLKGKVICPVEYEEIKGLNPRFMAVKKGNKWGLLSLASGSLVQNCQYDELDESYVLKEGFKIVLGEKEGLLAPDGKKLLLPVAYTDLRCVEAAGQNLIAYRPNSLYGLMDSTAKVLTLPLYHEITPQNSGLIQVKKGAFYGYLNTLGKEVIRPVWEQTSGFIRDRVVVNASGKKGVLDIAGKTILPPEYDDIEVYQANGMPVSMYGGALSMPSRSSGSSIPQTENLPYFFVLKRSGHLGVATWEGKLLLPTDYDRINAFWKAGNTYYYVFKAEVYGIANSQGRFILPLKYRTSASGDGANVNFLEMAPEWCLPISNNDLLGLFDLKNAAIVLPPVYQSISWLNPQLFTVEKEDSSANGTDRSTLTALYRIDGKKLRDFKSYLFCDAVANDRFVETEHLENGHTMTRLADLDGNILYEKDGWEFDRYKFNDMLLPDKFNPKARAAYGNGLLKLRGPKENIFIDRNGKEKAFEGYAYVGDFWNGLAVASKKVNSQEYVGIIDTNGRAIVEPVYEDMGPLFGKQEVLILQKDGKKGILDKQGKWLIAPAYDQIDDADEGGGFIVETGGKSGIVDSTGKVLLAPVYDRVYWQDKGQVYEVRKDNKVGFADKDGRVFIEPQFLDYEYNGGYDDFWPILVQAAAGWGYIGQDGKPLPVQAKEKLGY